MQRFHGKTILITGGSSGIGLASAQRIAREGGKLVLVARDAARLEQARAQLEGDEHETLVCDLLQEAAVEAAIAALAKRRGRIDGAVLAAGAHAVRPLSVSKAKSFQDMFEQNVLTTTNVIRPLVKAACPSDASIVLLSSAAGLTGSAAVSAYAAAKGAILALARSLALELAPKRIRVNAVVPGVVLTPMTEKFFASLPEDQVAAIRASHPLGVGNADDVAAAIAYLASDDARWTTGATLVVDGGLTVGS